MFSQHNYSLLIQTQKHRTFYILNLRHTYKVQVLNIQQLKWALLKQLLMIQRNLINIDTKGTCHDVRFIRVFILSGSQEKERRKNVMNTCFIDLEIKADIFL